jgi:hypothetical protein
MPKSIPDIWNLLDRTAYNQWAYLVCLGYPARLSSLSLGMALSIAYQIAGSIREAQLDHFLGEAPLLENHTSDLVQ